MSLTRIGRLVSAGVTAVAGLTVVASSAGASPSLTAQQLFRAAATNAKAATWVHETATVVSGSQAAWESRDIGVDRGRELVITSTHAMIRVLYYTKSPVVFIVGNGLGVQGLFTTSAHQTKDSGHWFYGSPLTSYGSLANGLTISSAFGTAFASSAGLTLLGPSVDHGVAVIGVRQVVPATATSPKITSVYYFTATGPTLPVSASEFYGGLLLTAHWSKWNVPATWATPRGALPVAKA